MFLLTPGYRLKVFASNIDLAWCKMLTSCCWSGCKFRKVHFFFLICSWSNPAGVFLIFKEFYYELHTNVKYLCVHRCDLLGFFISFNEELLNYQFFKDKLLCFIVGLNQMILTIFVCLFQSLLLAVWTQLLLEITTLVPTPAVQVSEQLAVHKHNSSV